MQRMACRRREWIQAARRRPPEMKPRKALESDTLNLYVKMSKEMAKRIRTEYIVSELSRRKSCSEKKKSKITQGGRVKEI